MGHIGTITVTEKFPKAINDAVKQLWYDLIAKNPNDIIGGFIPTNKNLPPFPPFQKGDSGGESWDYLPRVESTSLYMSIPNPQIAIHGGSQPYTRSLPCRLPN